IAGILEAPIDKWHVELCAPRPMISQKLRLDRYGQFVFAAMQNKNPVHLNRKASLRRNFPFDPVRPKNDFGILPAFENVLVHFLIAPIVAAVSACRVYADLTIGFTARSVKLDRTVLKCKGSMNGVEGCAKRPVHLALNRIDAENKFSS